MPQILFVVFYAGWSPCSARLASQCLPINLRPMFEGLQLAKLVVIVWPSTNFLHCARIQGQNSSNSDSITTSTPEIPLTKLICFTISRCINATRMSPVNGVGWKAAKARRQQNAPIVQHNTLLLSSSIIYRHRWHSHAHICALKRLRCTSTFVIVKAHNECTDTVMFHSAQRWWRWK